MKKVYIIGAEKSPDAIESARKICELSEDVEIVLVESIEDVPLSERIKAIPQIHKITAIPRLPDIEYVDAKKKNNHIRPYKFHR